MVLEACTLIECEHMPVPMPVGCCTICTAKASKKPRRKAYVRHKHETLLASGRAFTNHRLAMWYPYGTDMPILEGVVHVCGGWSATHIENLLKGNRFLHTVEFAPAQKPTVQKYLQLFASQPGGAVGIVLKARR